MAQVIALPTAAANQIVQQPRRGRFPRGVVNVHHGAHLRQLRENAEKERGYQRGLEEGRRAAEADSRERKRRRAELIELLEAMLNHARSGNLLTLAAAGDFHGYGLRFYFRGDAADDANRAVLMSARLQHRMAEFAEAEDAGD
jgi:hypothetical protein